MSEEQSPQGGPGANYPVSLWEMLRVMIATLLILFGGYVLVSAVGFYELAGPQLDAPPEEVAEQFSERLSEEGLSSLPLSVKILAVVVQGSLILPALLFLRRKQLAARVYLRLNPVPWRLALYSLVVGFGIAVIGDELSRIVEMIAPMPESMSDGITRLLRLRSVGDLLTMGLTVALIAPIAEEALFRGFFQRYFEANHGVTNGVLWASALFASYHFNLYWLIPILLMATVMGAMAWRAESILPAILVHSANNTLGLVTVNLNGGEDPAWYSMGGHVSPIVLGVALLLLFVALRAFFREAEEAGLGGHGPGGHAGTHVDITG